ncbi:hypothetical protein K503DRAFT_537639 [Rhizopogon vinicolor AM-OR11-026]|uniref:Uncharacterized protein n=1 Tax=Rhizopogon vinicolor AM-OR11-026 TaxID=1314800 RepID=A0A1B7MKV5_9AGAM|nr:hypothetical protein K503DRAFT_537639 [Rhizopogon vinicolor AM-OR11-026]
MKANEKNCAVSMLTSRIASHSSKLRKPSSGKSVFPMQRAPTSRSWRRRGERELRCLYNASMACRSLHEEGPVAGGTSGPCCLRTASSRYGSKSHFLQYPLPLRASTHMCYEFPVTQLSPSMSYRYSAECQMRSHSSTSLYLSSTNHPHPDAFLWSWRTLRAGRATNASCD